MALTGFAALIGGCQSSRLFSRRDDIDLPSRETASQHASRSETSRHGQPGESQQSLAAARTGGTSERNSGRMSLPVSEHLERAERAVSERRLSEASQHLEAIVAQQPAHPRAHHLLAVIADLEGRFPDAERHYQAAIQAEPANAAFIGDLGYSYLLQGRLELAEQYLQQARRLDPLHVNAARNLALLYSKRGDYDSSRRALQEILPPAEVERMLAQLFAPPPGGSPAAGMPMPTQLAMSAQNDPRYGPPGLPLARDYAAQSYPPGMYGTSSGYYDDAASANRDPQTGMQRQFDAARFAPLPQANVATASGSMIGQPTEMSSPPAGYGIAAPSGPGPIQHAAAFQTMQGGVNPRSAEPIMPATPIVERQWPPSTWPPTGDRSGNRVEPASAPFDSTSAASPSADVERRTGVIHLMQRPPAQATSTNPFTGYAPNGPAAVPPMGGDPATPTPRVSTWSGSAPAVSPGVSQLEYNYPQGPDGSAAEAERQYATRMGLSVGPDQPIPSSPRSSPGTGSMWNGNQYPAPERQLPGMSPPANPGSLSSQIPGISDPLITRLPAPTGYSSQSPQSPLLPYDAQRARYDQQMNDRVQQTYAQSPANFIPSPTASMTAPVHQLPAYNTRPTTAAPPVSPDSNAPWPGRPASMTAAPAATAETTPPAAQTGTVIPQPYHRSPSTGASLRSDEPYPYARTVDQGYQGPVIIPGSR